MNRCYLAASDGIYTYTVSDDGTLSLFDRYPADRPMYFAFDGGRLFALLCDPAGDGNSAVLPVWVDDAGLPTDPSPSVSTEGRVGCHLSVTDDVVYAANYSSGSIARMMLDGSETALLVREGHSVHPTRQEMPHTHYIAPMPGGTYLAVCDLGTDSIAVYDRDLTVVSECRVPDGCGPRHLCYSPDGRYAYCANELSSTVSILSCDGDRGTFVHLSEMSTRSTAYGTADREACENYPAAIRCDGGFVYVSNRGDDDIAVFRIEEDGASLVHLSNLPAGGHWPRDLFVSDDLLIVTNERSDSVTVFRMSGDRMSSVLLQTLTDLPAPIAVLCV